MNTFKDSPNHHFDPVSRRWKRNEESNNFKNFMSWVSNPMDTSNNSHDQDTINNTFTSIIDDFPVRVSVDDMRNIEGCELGVHNRVHVTSRNEFFRGIAQLNGWDKHGDIEGVISSEKHMKALAQDDFFHWNGWDEKDGVLISTMTHFFINLDGSINEDSLKNFLCNSDEEEKYVFESLPQNSEVERELINDSCSFMLDMYDIGSEIVGVTINGEDVDIYSEEEFIDCLINKALLDNYMENSTQAEKCAIRRALRDSGITDGDNWGVVDNGKQYLHLSSFLKEEDLRDMFVNEGIL